MSSKDDFFSRIKTNPTENANRPLTIRLIDDDESLKEDLEKRLPNVFFILTSIGGVIRRIRHRAPMDADLYFIDAFYRDEESGGYAIDFFEMYKNLSEEMKDGLEGKYKVLIGIDDVNERLENQTSKDIDHVNERTRMSQLMGKIRKHPYLEWGKNKGSKVDRIVEEIEKYAAKRGINIKKIQEMSLDEWIDTIGRLIHRIENFTQDIRNENVSDHGKDVLNGIVNNLLNATSDAKAILGLERPTHVKERQSIEGVIECANKLCDVVMDEMKKTSNLAIREKNNELSTLVIIMKVIATNKKK